MREYTFKDVTITVLAESAEKAYTKLCNSIYRIENDDELEMETSTYIDHQSGEENSVKTLYPLDLEQVRCSVCKVPTDLKTAHLHQEEYIGDECCWDERLRTTE